MKFKPNSEMYIRYNNASHMGINYDYVHELQKHIEKLEEENEELEDECGRMNKTINEMRFKLKEILND